MTRPVELKQAGLYLTFVRVSLMLFRVDTIEIAIQIQMKRMFHETNVSSRKGKARSHGASWQSSCEGCGPFQCPLARENVVLFCFSELEYILASLTVKRRANVRGVAY